MKEDIRVLKNLTILIAEDDEVVLNELTKIGTILFKNVFASKNGKQALSLYETQKIDIILTDIKMPFLDGISLIKKIREINYEIPIVILSSYSEQSTLLKALKLGVDGYIIKPIELNEFVDVLLKATRRNKNNVATQVIGFKTNKIFNTVTKELFSEGTRVELGAKELLLLELFIQNHNKTLSKEEIVLSLWPLDEITNSALKGVLNRLRKKIGDEYISNVKGFGWKFSID